MYLHISYADTFLSQVGAISQEKLSAFQRTRIDKINKYENLRQKFGYFFTPSPAPLLLKSVFPLGGLWLLTFALEFIEKSIVALNAPCKKKNKK